MIALAEFALSLAVLAGGQTTEPSAVSANARFTARIARAPGQERVAELLARRLVTVRASSSDPAEPPFWSCPFPEIPDPAGRYLLSDDGSTFVALTRVFAPAREVVRVFRYGEQVASYTGRDLDLGRGEFETGEGGVTWLSDPDDRARLAWHETPHGPSLVLELESVREWTRAIDLTEGGLVSEAAALEPVLHPGIDPKLRGVVRVPRVERFTLPASVLAGLPVELHVEGSHPVANWQLCGFTVEVLDAEGFELRIVPQTRPPTPGTLPGQRFMGFRGDATLHDLAPGRYLIHVQGSEPQEARLPARAVEVLPGRLRARLRTTGGILGLDETVELFVPGIVRATSSRADPDDPPRRFLVRGSTLEQLEAALQVLAGETPPPLRTTPDAADLFQYQLEWWNGQTWRHVERDEGTAHGAVGDLIEALRRAARTAAY